MPKSKTVYKLSENHKLLSPNHENDVAWAFCREKNSNTLYMLDYLVHCRESIVSIIMDQRKVGDYKVPLTSVKLLIGKFLRYTNIDITLVEPIKKEFFEQLKIGLKIVNIMEKRNKWPLTKLVDIEIPKDRIMGKLLIAPTRWMRSPHMLSLFMLLIRSGRLDSLQNVKNYVDIIKTIKKYNARQNGDKGHLKKTYKYWDLIMSNFTTLFKNLSAVKNWDVKTYKDIQYWNEGITKLCTKRSGHVELTCRFKELIKTNKIKKQNGN